MQMHELKIFLNEESFIQLEDDYINKADDLRMIVFGHIKKLVKEARSVLRNKQFGANVIDTDLQEDKGGNPQKIEAFKLKEFDLEPYTLPSDPDWLPENLDKDEVQPYKIKVGDNTYKLLVVYGQLHDARVSLYNKNLDQKVAGFNKELDMPKHAKCLEQVIHEQVINHLIALIDAAFDKELDAELDEIYHPDKAKKESRKGKKKDKKPKEKKIEEPPTVK